MENSQDLVWCGKLRRKPVKAKSEAADLVVVKPSRYWRCQDCETSAKDNGRYGTESAWAACNMGRRAGEVHLPKSFGVQVMSEFQMSLIKLLYWWILFLSLFLFDCNSVLIIPSWNKKVCSLFFILQAPSYETLDF